MGAAPAGAGPGPSPGTGDQFGKLGTPLGIGIWDGRRPGTRIWDHLGNGPVTGNGGWHHPDGKLGQGTGAAQAPAPPAGSGELGPVPGSPGHWQQPLGPPRHWHLDQHWDQHCPGTGYWDKVPLALPGTWHQDWELGKLEHHAPAEHCTPGSPRHQGALGHHP